MHKTRARDTELRHAIRHYTARKIKETNNPHTTIYIADAGSWLFLHGLARTEVEGMQYAGLILDHLVLEGEYRYASPTSDAYSKLTLEEEARVYSAMAENALLNPGVKEHIEVLAERAARAKKTDPSTDK